MALLILNETCTFEKVLEQLDAGKTVEDLMKAKSEYHMTGTDGERFIFFL